MQGKERGDLNEHKSILPKLDVFEFHHFWPGGS
jgi:hypothetical protein